MGVVVCRVQVGMWGGGGWGLCAGVKERGSKRTMRGLEKVERQGSCGC